MENYYFSRKGPSPTPTSYRGIGNERIQPRQSSIRNVQPPKSLRLNISDNYMLHNPDSVVHDGFLTTRSGSSRIFSSPLDSKPVTDRPTTETAQTNRSTNGRISDDTRGTVNQFPRSLTPNKDLGLPTFGSFLAKEKKLQNKPKPEAQPYFETSPAVNDDYDFDYTERFNAAWSQSMAYAGAMKALQNKIKSLETQNGQIMEENEELKQLNQLETEKSARLEKRLEEYKVIEARIREQVGALESESRYLAEMLEAAQNERQVLERNLIRLKEENITLRDENGTTNRVNKDNSALLQELLSNEKYSESDLKTSVELLRRENEDLIRQNDELIARCNKAETDLKETKKIYKEHLQELVLKNETLSRQLESCKNFYTNQINDFQRDLSSIEEANKSKMKELEIEKHVLKGKIKDMKRMLAGKDREIEELKQNLGKFMNHVFENESAINKSSDFNPGSHNEASSGIRSSKFPGGSSPEDRFSINEQLQGNTLTANPNLKKVQLHDEPNDISDKFDAISPLSVHTAYSKNEPNFHSELFGIESPAFRPSVVSKSQNEYGLDEKFEGKSQNKSRFAQRGNGGQGGGSPTGHESYVLERKDPRMGLSVSQNDVASSYLTDEMGRSPTVQANEKYPEFNIQQNNPSNRVSAGSQNLHIQRGLSFGKDDNDTPLNSGRSGREKERALFSQFKQDMKQKQTEEAQKSLDVEGNEQDYVDIIENIIATEKEIENLNNEYKLTMEKAQVRFFSKLVMLIPISIRSLTMHLRK